jgi:hypothetical protein
MLCTSQVNNYFKYIVLLVVTCTPACVDSSYSGFPFFSVIKKIQAITEMCIVIITKQLFSDMLM